MYQPGSISAPRATSPSMSREAMALRLPAVADVRLASSDSPVAAWNPLQGFSAMAEPPRSSDGGCFKSSCIGANWRSDTQRLVSQSSCVRLSQSLRWSGGGVVVESHAASTRVVCAAPQPFENCSCGLFDINHQERNSGFYHGRGTASSATWDGASPSSDRVASFPAIASTSTTNAPLKGRNTALQMHAVQFVRKLEVIQEPSSQPAYSRRSSSNQGSVGSLSRALSADAASLGLLQGPFNPGPPLPATRSRAEAGALCTAPHSALALKALPSHLPERPGVAARDHVLADTERHQSNLSRSASTLLDVPVGAPQGVSARQMAKPIPEDSLKYWAPITGGEHKNGSEAVARRRSSVPPVGLSSVRRVKGPLFRAQSLEAEASSQRANKVAVRPRSTEVGPEYRGGSMSTANSAGRFGPFDGYYKSDGSAPTLSQSDRSRSEVVGIRPRPVSSSPASSGSGVSLSTPDGISYSQGRRRVSTAEAYFGRVPRRSTDFQRLLSFPEPEGQFVAGDSFEAATGKQAHAKNARFNGTYQREPERSRGGRRLGGNIGQRRTGSSETKEPSSTGKGRDDRKRKERKSTSKSRDAFDGLPENTEAATVVRALAAAQASAAAAAEERAANAGPLPAWRRQERTSASNPEKALRSMSTVRRGLSFPKAFFAKVKARLTRSKSDRT